MRGRLFPPPRRRWPSFDVTLPTAPADVASSDPPGQTVTAAMLLCPAPGPIEKVRLPLPRNQLAVTPNDCRGFRDWCGFLVLLAIVLCSERVQAEEACGDFPGAPLPVARLVSSVGE